MVASSGSFLVGQRVDKLLATVITVYADVEIERQMFCIERDRLPKPCRLPAVPYCLERAMVDMNGNGFAGVLVDADNRDDATEIENTCDTHANGFHGFAFCAKRAVERPAVLDGRVGSGCGCWEDLEKRHETALRVTVAVDVALCRFDGGVTGKQLYVADRPVRFVCEPCRLGDERSPS